MTRKEGILKRYFAANPRFFDGVTLETTIKEVERIVLQVEYNNYLELCEFCGEQPLPKEIWLNDTITPATPVTN